MILDHLSSFSYGADLPKSKELPILHLLLVQPPAPLCRLHLWMVPLEGKQGAYSLNRRASHHPPRRKKRRQMTPSPSSQSSHLFFSWCYITAKSSINTRMHHAVHCRKIPVRSARKNSTSSVHICCFESVPGKWAFDTTRTPPMVRAL